MPFKNSSEFLEEAIESVKTQSYAHWELITIDDLSTDDSLDILSKLAKGDTRIKLYSADGNGIIDALSQAFSKCNGDYITRFDSDDLMSPDRLEVMLKEIKLTASNTIITGLVKYFSKEVVSDGYRKYERWLNKISLENTQWNNVYRECTIASPNWLARKDAITTIGGFESLEYPEDYDLVFQWYKRKFEIKTINQTTLFWREHQNRTSRNSVHYQQKAFFKLKVTRFFQIDYDPSRPLVIWGKGVKADLTMSILKQNHIPFQNHDLQHYQNIEKHNNALLLIAVYPDSFQRERMEKYLHNLKSSLLLNWWYL